MGLDSIMSLSNIILPNGGNVDLNCHLLAANTVNAAAMNVSTFTADTLSVNNLNVINDSIIGGNETVDGNLVAGRVSSGSDVEALVGTGTVAAKHLSTNSTSVLGGAVSITNGGLAVTGPSPNISAAGNITATGNITTAGGTVSGGTVSGGTVSGGTITSTGAINADRLFVTGSQGADISSSLIAGTVFVPQPVSSMPNHLVLGNAVSADNLMFSGVSPIACSVTSGIITGQTSYISVVGSYATFYWRAQYQGGPTNTVTFTFNCAVPDLVNNTDIIPSFVLNTDAIGVLHLIDPYFGNPATDPSQIATVQANTGGSFSLQSVIKFNNPPDSIFPTLWECVCTCMYRLRRD